MSNYKVFNEVFMPTGKHAGPVATLSIHGRS